MKPAMTPFPKPAKPDGETSPRLPHERDESVVTRPPAPRTRPMRIARDDAESSKTPTDRSEESDAAYAKLRGSPPGKERDETKASSGGLA